MKTILAIAIGAILLGACSSSDNDEPVPLDDPNTPSGTDTGGTTGTGTDGTDGTTDTGTDGTPGTDTDGTTGTDTGGTTGTGTDGPVGAAPPLDEVSNELLVDLAAYGTYDDARRVRELADVAAGTSLGSRSLPGRELSLNGYEGPLTATTTAVEHDCALGGTFVSDAGSIDDTLYEAGSSLESEAFRFDQCRLAGEVGETIVDGDLLVTVNYRYGSRADIGGTDHAWSEFSLIDADGDGFEIDGAVDYGASNDTYQNVRTRTVALSRYASVAGGAIVERLEDVELTLTTICEGSCLFDIYFLEASGSVTNEASGGRAVTIETVTPLTRKRRVDEFQDDPDIEPFEGELSFRAEDGAMLTVTARDTDTEELRVDRRYVAADGMARTSENVPFAALTVPSPDDEEAKIERD